MSMTLILWKAPLVADADEADRLLKSYYDRGDDSAFEPSADIATVAKELTRRFPEAEDGPWADSPPAESERVLLLSIRWKAKDTVIDAIVALAKEYELVLYDPQGPDVHLPGDPVEAEPVRPPRIVDNLTIPLIGLAAAGTFWLGWRTEVPMLGLALMILGGFLFSVVVFLIGILLFGPKAGKTS